MKNEKKRIPHRGKRLVKVPGVKRNLRKRKRVPGGEEQGGEDGQTG